MSHNAVSAIFEQAARRPASPAIATHERVIDYAVLQRYVGILAGFLRNEGIGAGEIVGVTMAQNPLHLMTILALAQIGAVSLPLHPAVPTERRLLAARRFGAGWVVSGRKEFALEELKFADLARVSFAAGSPVDYAIHPVGADDPMRIAISSGTSGDPKGIVLSHSMMATRNATSETGANADSRTLPLDLNFIIGLRPSIGALSRGSTVVFPPSMTAADLLQTMKEFKITHIVISPLQAKEIADAAGPSGIACPDLICLRVGGGPMSADLLHAIATRITPNVYSLYASTESSMVTYATPEMLARHPDTVGRVCEWATLEVVGEENRPLPPGQSGAIRIRSTHQVDHYLCDEERTRRHFHDGWFYPGDLGHFDEEGLFYVDGRADEQMNIGGMKIDPTDIEDTLARHPAVKEVGAFEMVVENGYPLLAVALVLTDAARLDEVRRHALEQLGPLAPQRYFTCAALPRTETGKLKRMELAARY